MPITSKLKRHKIMERTMRALMGNNLPPRFKFKDTYDSIEVPAAYQQHLPTPFGPSPPPKWSLLLPKTSHKP